MEGAKVFVTMLWFVSIAAMITFGYQTFLFAGGGKTQYWKVGDARSDSNDNDNVALQSERFEKSIAIAFGNAIKWRDQNPELMHWKARNEKKTSILRLASRSHGRSQ